MPNGGSDCCGTCWFNPRVQARQAEDPNFRALRDYCEIRDLTIELPYWTYCANHPHRSPEPDRIPVGPVLRDADASLHRRVWQPSPDTAEIRTHLLALLAAVEEQPKREYPLGAQRDEVVVWQLGKFRERRAISDLERIAAFDPALTAGEPLFPTRARLVQLAREALEEIRAPKDS
jgi:hypothetical protein